MAFVSAIAGLAGYDPDRARELAPAVSRHIYRTCCILVDGRWQACAWSGSAGVPNEVCYGYDRELVRSLQLAVGFVGDDADGVYGPKTRGALIHFGVPNPPPALFGHGTTPYTPPVGHSSLPPSEAHRLPAWIGAALISSGTGMIVWWLAARRRRR